MDDSYENFDSYFNMDFFEETEQCSQKQAKVVPLAIEPCMKPNVNSFDSITTQKATLSLQYIQQRIKCTGPLLYQQLLTPGTSSKQAAAMAAAIALGRIPIASISPYVVSSPQIPTGFASPTTVPNSPLSPTQFSLNSTIFHGHTALMSQVSQETQTASVSPPLESEANYSPVSDFDMEDDVETSSVSSDSTNASQKSRGKYKKHAGEKFKPQVSESDKLIHKFTTGGIIKRIFQNKKGGTYIKEVDKNKVAPFTGCIHMSQNNPNSRQNYIYIELQDGITSTQFCSQYAFVEPQGVVACEFHKQQPKANFVVCYFKWATDQKVIARGHYVPFIFRDTVNNTDVFEGSVRIFRTAVTNCPEKCCNRAKCGKKTK